MKRHIKIAMLASLLGASGACSDSFLDRNPKAVMETTQITNVQGVEGTLIGAYGLMNGNRSGTWGNYAAAPSQWLFGEVAADNAHKGSEKNDQASMFDIEMHNTISVNEHLAVMWNNYYEGILRCNNTLRLLEAVQTGNGEKFSAARATEIQAEARMLRAHYYFYLWRVFKNIPWVDETTKATDVATVPNDVDVMPKIVADLVFAEANLPADKPLSQAGRSDKIAAKAYLGKVYLYQKEYAKALPLFNDVIADKPALETLPFEDNFDIKKEGGPEAIFVSQHAINPDGGGDNANVGDMLGGIHGKSPTGCCGFFRPSVDLVNAFKVDANGLPDADYRTNPYMSDLKYPIVNAPGDTTFYAFSLDANRRFDPRLDHTVGRRDVTYRDWGVFPGNAWLRAPAFGGPFVGQKHMIDQADFPGNTQSGVTYVTGLDVNIIRLADVYLMAAECAAQTGNLSQALARVNAVRKRAATVAKKKTAGGTDAADYDVKEYASFADQTDAMEKIKTERRLELALEGHRFFDLVRWGDAKAVLEDYHNNFEGPQLNSDYSGFTFDPKFAAQLLDTGDAHGQNEYADHRAPDVDAARFDGGRPEKRADQRGQQKIQADAGLADAQLGGQHHPSERGQCARGDKRRDDVAAGRDAV